ENLLMAILAISSMKFLKIPMRGKHVYNKLRMITLKV
ncbi:uncharacterized protein METZ01_LOCUS293471, partial [marine metagenome]